MDGLTGTALREKYLEECGVYADAANLTRWITSPPQALAVLENNEDVHSHPCGEYVLEQLQKGEKPEQVVSNVLARFLVRTTRDRVLAYRRYREQRGEYWSIERLELRSWEYLYGRVSLDGNIVRPAGGVNNAGAQRRILALRADLCKELDLAEELVPVSNIQAFYRHHEAFVKLALKYPAATVSKISMDRKLVDAYSAALPAELPKSAYGLDLHAMVAESHGIIVWPLASARACAVAAYAMARCKELYSKQCFSLRHCIFIETLRVSTEGEGGDPPEVTRKTRG